MHYGKSKPSEIAAEVKTLYIPHIVRAYPQFPVRSTSYPNTDKLRVTKFNPGRRLRVAVVAGDPVDVALDWHDSSCKDTIAGRASKSSISGLSIPILNMANEKRPGGDWESSTIAPEEYLCRRSTPVRVLVTPSSNAIPGLSYRLRATGGIYSPSIGICRLMFSFPYAGLTLSSGLSCQCRWGLLSMGRIQILTRNICGSRSTAETRRVGYGILLRAREGADERDDESNIENCCNEIAVRSGHWSIWSPLWLQKFCSPSREDAEGDSFLRGRVPRPLFERCLRD